MLSFILMLPDFTLLWFCTTKLNILGWCTMSLRSFFWSAIFVIWKLRYILHLYPNEVCFVGLDKKINVAAVYFVSLDLRHCYLISYQPTCLPTLSSYTFLSSLTLSDHVSIAKKSNATSSCLNYLRQNEISLKLY